jgi:hypothetical protein
VGCEPDAVSSSIALADAKLIIAGGAAVIPPASV